MLIIFKLYLNIIKLYLSANDSTNLIFLESNLTIRQAMVLSALLDLVTPHWGMWSEGIIQKEKI